MTNERVKTLPSQHWHWNRCGSPGDEVSFLETFIFLILPIGPGTWESFHGFILKTAILNKTLKTF